MCITIKLPEPEDEKEKFAIWYISEQFKNPEQLACHFDLECDRGNPCIIISKMCYDKSVLELSKVISHEYICHLLHVFQRTKIIDAQYMNLKVGSNTIRTDNIATIYDNAKAIREYVEDWIIEI